MCLFALHGINLFALPLIFALYMCQVDQLNRNVFHYAASRGDEKLLNFLRAFDPSTDERTTSNNNNEVCSSSSSSSSSRGSGDDDDDDDDESTSSASSQGNNQEVKSDHPCGAFLEVMQLPQVAIGIQIYEFTHFKVACVLV